MNSSQNGYGVVVAVILLVGVALQPSTGLADQQLNGTPSLAGTTPATPHFAGSADHVHVLKVARASDEADDFVVTLGIDSGFHINANPASFENLIPTSLMFAGAEPKQVIYPQSVRFKPKFADESLDVYEGTITIAAVFPKGTFNHLAPLDGKVTVQACTDQVCFPPADLPVPER